MGFTELKVQGSANIPLLWVLKLAHFQIVQPVTFITAVIHKRTDSSRIIKIEFSNFMVTVKLLKIKNL